ncbi:hypothetical protein DHD32_16025 [Arenibacter sp. TNZ]|nr:hypothetical protein [Arenibacter sp. TNZ]
MLISLSLLFLCRQFLLLVVKSNRKELQFSKTVGARNNLLSFSHREFVTISMEICGRVGKEIVKIGNS